MSIPDLVIKQAAGDDYAVVAALMREYIDWLPFDVSGFQDVEREMADLPSEYGPPGGVALLAILEGRPVGVVGVRRFSGDVAELKRMWVRPEGRGAGLGRALATAARSVAGDLGYRTIRLDTVAGLMDGANRLYESLGFHDIAPYRDNPIPGARFMELDLPADDDLPAP